MRGCDAILIAGPTASGKSALALRLADALNSTRPGRLDRA
jgi:tRNA A37 N6-isopentenylltransferase MiaA